MNERTDATPKGAHKQVTALLWPENYAWIAAQGRPVTVLRRLANRYEMMVRSAEASVTDKLSADEIASAVKAVGMLDTERLTADTVQIAALALTGAIQRKVTLTVPELIALIGMAERQ